MALSLCIAPCTNEARRFIAYMLFGSLFAGLRSSHLTYTDQAVNGSRSASIDMPDV